MVSAALARRQAQPLDLLQAAAMGDGWEGLEAFFLPRGGRQEFEPDDELAVFVHGLSKTVSGREFIEYLMDITLRLPLRITGSSIEQTALQAATRQGINGVGEVILALLVKGERIANGGRNQNGAGK